MVNQLPEDVLTNIIRRLAPRYLAISRCVCKTWCAIIDACNMLRADLLPHSLCGIFINFNELSMSEFFSRPSKGPTISGYFDYLPCISTIYDHCNGLLLLHNFVVNPATRQWEPLPPYPSRALGYKQYLVFDPTLSPNYEVLLLPHVRCYVKLNMFNFNFKLDPAMAELEWPPSPCIMYVLSSRTKEWEERPFVREGEAAGNVADMLSDCSYVQDSAVYWRGLLYVNCRTKFIMRISLSNTNYQVIKPPLAIDEEECTDLYLGQSEKGVYCALYFSPILLQFYILDESSGKMEWVFKNSCTICSTLSCQRIDEPGSWTLQDINHQDCCNQSADDNKDAVGEKFEWDSDSDYVIDTRNRGIYGSLSDITFLGFHPYREVVFLCDKLKRGLAYHLNSSKVQDLGSLHPTHYGAEMDSHPFIQGSFPYTPWMGEFPNGVN